MLAAIAPKTTHDILQQTHHLPLQERFDTISKLARTIVLEGNHVVEELEKILASREVTILGLPKQLEKENREHRDCMVPFNITGGVVVYKCHEVSGNIHDALCTRRFIQALFLACPPEDLKEFEILDSEKYFVPGVSVEIAIGADSLVVARYLRQHPECFDHFVTMSAFNWVITYQYLAQFGLPFNALDPFCRAISNVSEKAQEYLEHTNCHIPVLKTILKDFPEFVLRGKVPDAYLEIINGTNTE